jgi:hypothetical protein
MIIGRKEGEEKFYSEEEIFTEKLKKMFFECVDEFLMKKNVFLVSIGIKKVGGRNTGEKSLVALVERKVLPEMLPKYDRIPKMVDGVKTDVVEKAISFRNFFNSRA